MKHFLAEPLTPGAMTLLREYPWPGNVRELKNCLERLVVFSDARPISGGDVQRELARNRPDDQGPARREVDCQALTEALARTKGNKTNAARVLGISRRNLYNKIDAFGLK